MDAGKVLRIKELIEKSKIENAKNQGIIENIQKEWKEKYGSDKLEDAQKHLIELQDEMKNSEERIEKLYQDLVNSYDWDKLEEELE